MKSAHRYRTVVAALAGATLIPSLLAAPAYAISGGAPADTAALPYLATIEVGTVGTGASCSGTLINKHWVVTSAACFATTPSQPETPAPGAPHVETTATIGGQTRNVDRIVPRDDRDLVLAHLASPTVGISTLDFTTTSPTAGQAVQTTGYGRTADTWVPNQPQTGDFTIESVNPTALSLQGTTDGTSICQGDAGGPVIADGTLAAVAGGSHQANCIGETSEQTGAIAARVDDILDWAVAQILDLQATPASKHAINLTWAHQEAAASYRVYAAQTPTVAIEPDNLIADTTQPRYTHGSLPAGETWYYRVTAHDTAGTQFGVSTTATADSPTATTTDFNGDGIDDIASFASDATNVALSDGTAQFGTAAQWGGGLLNAGGVAYPGDFNGDGLDDIVRFNSGPVDVALSDGEHFGQPQRWHDHFGLDGQWVRTGDVDGDGRDDILSFTGGTSADVFVTLSTGSGFGATQKWHDSFSGGTNRPAVGDFNGDGKDDIVNFHPDGRVFVSLSDGTQFVQNDWRWLTGFTAPGQTPAVGDFNGDSKDDIVNFELGADGNVDIALSLSTNDSFTAKQQWHDRFGRNDEWVGVGNFNGDNTSDLILFTRTDTANVWVTLSDGTTFGAATQWHDNFAAGTAYPIPTWQR